MRTEKYRYMEMRTENGAGQLRGVGLFDLEKDPSEMQSVHADPAYSSLRANLEKEFGRLREQYDAPLFP